MTALFDVAFKHFESDITYKQYTHLPISQSGPFNTFVALNYSTYIYLGTLL